MSGPNKASVKAQGFWRIFVLPIAIALFSIIGLVAALTGDGWRDVLSWAALAIPVLAVLWAMRARRY